MMYIKRWGILLLVFSSLVSCNDDEQVMPAYRQDLAELSTDYSGRATYLYFDDGRQKQINNNVSGLVPDTLYRVMALYTEDGHRVNLEGARTVISPLPMEADEVQCKRDPLKLKALWKSSRYINLLVGVKSGSKQQGLGFVDDGIETTSDGLRKLKLTLYHDQMDDPQYYTQEVYLSCPVYQYSEELVQGTDSVEMQVNTSEGMKKVSFLY